MRLEPPVPVSQEEYTLNVRDIEPLLQGYPMETKPWRPATIKLPLGEDHVHSRSQDQRSQNPLGVCSEGHGSGARLLRCCWGQGLCRALGWYRKRIKDPYVIIGIIDGKLAGLVNGRLMNEKINISHHTMTFRRGGRLGAALFYCKAYYAFEILGQEEFWSTYESYNGWRIGFLGMAQPSYPWPDVQHELGGARVYYVTKAYWDLAIKRYSEELVGSALNFDVPSSVIKANEKLVLPDEVSV